MRLFPPLVALIVLPSLAPAQAAAGAQAPAEPAKAAAPADAQKMQGRWDLVYAECDGTDATKQAIANWQSIVFDEQRLTRPNGGTYHADPKDNFLRDAYKLGAADGLKTIEIQEPDGVTHGWYVVDEDRLVIRVSIDLATRKRDGGAKTLLVFQRPPT